MKAWGAGKRRRGSNLRKKSTDAAVRRGLIVYDGKGWFARRVRLIEHDLDRDEKVYRCDAPIGRRYRTLAAAARSLTAWIEGKST